MQWFNDVLLMVHFLGLAMGFGGGFGNMIMGGLMAKATPADAGVLARFPPAISRLGDIGLVLLWVTGVTLVFTKYGGIGSLPGMFWVKMIAVVALTGIAGYMHMLKAKAKAGDVAARAMIPKVGPFALISALLAIVFAVLAFH